ncbi:hypothetical protein [Mycolicibacterium fortuitum]|uniref:hypothetical protein n=1 Tax=Mycolicibacterium fortuitum TaxID=1766 RepID=UPI002620BCF1|nr:hypothetical protein [Mycolicibacterium fortuitum]
MPDPAPTPNNMPGAETATTETEAGTAATDTGTQEAAPTVDELTADRDKWRDLARQNEQRAKGNSKKAKEYDDHFEDYKAAWEREQANRTADQKAADAEAEAEKRAQAAEQRAVEAERKALVLEHASTLPGFMHGLITGTTEEEVTEQVTGLKAALDAYVEELGAPRRPEPVPALGRGSGTTSSTADQFAATLANLF